MPRGGPESVTLLARLPALGSLPTLAPVSEAVFEVSKPSPGQSVLHMRSYEGAMLAERDIPWAPRWTRLAIAPDERRLAVLGRRSDGTGSVVEILGLRQGGAGISVTMPGHVDEAAWLGRDELLVVGRSGDTAWAHMVYPGVRDRRELQVAAGSASGEKEARTATQVALEHAPSENVSRVCCSSSRLIAVISSRGSLPLAGEGAGDRDGELRHVIDLLRVGGEFPPQSAHQLEVTCPFLVPGPTLARDGRHLLLADMLGGAGVVRLDDVANNAGDLLRLEADGAETALADGDCVVGQRAVDERVRAWRSTPEGLEPWADWEPTGGCVDVMDVVLRGARADVLVRDRSESLLICRLGDRDLLDLRSPHPDRRRRALWSLAERRDPDTAEPLVAELAGDDPDDRALAARTLAAIGGDALDAVVSRLGNVAHGEVGPLLETLATVPTEELDAAAGRCWALGADARMGAVRLLHGRRDLVGTTILPSALRSGEAALAALAADVVDLGAVPEAIVDLIALAGNRNPELAQAAVRALRRYLNDVGVLASGVDGDVLAADTPDVQGILEARRVAPDEAPILGALVDTVAQADRPGADVLNALDALAGAGAHRPTALALAVLLSGRLSGSDPVLAARLLERAIEWSDPADLDVPAVRWRAQLERARLSGPSHAPRADRAAREWLRAAMASVDRSWSQLLGDPADAHFFAEKAELYDAAMLTELRLGSPAAAVDVLERAKTRYLVDLIARRHDPRVRTLEPVDELFWEMIGAARPRITRGPAVGGPRLGAVRATAQADPDGPLPEHLARLRAEPNALGRSVVDSLWELIAHFTHEPAEKVARAKAVLEEVDATLVRAPAAARGEDVMNAADVQGAYLRGARALLAIDDAYWALNEFSDRWLISYLSDPEGLERHTLAALREAIAYVTERAPVRLVTPPAADAETEAYARTAGAALAFEPLPPDSTPAGSFAGTFAEHEAGRLRLSSRRRWEEVERLARGETAGFREAAQRLLDEPGLGLVQFAVTEAGTVVLVAAHGAALGTPGLPELAGWGEPAVFTSGEITARWLADALSAPTQASWMTAYNRREENPGRWAEATDTLLAKLHAELFAAPGKWLQARSVNRLLVVPHRGLHQLPLGAWFSQPRRGPRRYVIDDFELFFSPSLSLHEVCVRRAPDATRTVDEVLVVAPPGRCLSLSGIDALALPAGARILRDGEASAEEWSRAAAGAHLCHYQGHATYRWEQPLQSELTLAGPPITLGDLFDDALEMPHVHAVTLSGCETTMTALDPADEWLGLAAGFMFAGAPAVLSTHWAIRELPASMLVERYYRELRSGRRPSAALGTAQRWLRDDVTRADCEAFLRRVIGATGISEGEHQGLLQGLPHGRRARPFAAPVCWGAHTVAGLDRQLRWLGVSE